MEKRPTIEEVKEYFKDAKSIEAVTGLEIKIKNDAFHFSGVDFWHTDKTGYHFIVWSPEKGYAKILSYKKPKGFTITKEQILELCMPSLKCNRERFEIMFPKAFQEEKKELVKNTWITKNIDSPWIVFVDNSNNLYGIDMEGNWFNYSRQESTISAMLSNKKNREATTQEVEEALKSECLKRYKIGAHINCLHGQTNYSLIETDNFLINIERKCIRHENKKGFWSCVFESGKWAEIIPTLSPQQAEEKLKELGVNVKIVNNK